MLRFKKNREMNLSRVSSNFSMIFSQCERKSEENNKRKRNEKKLRSGSWYKREVQGNFGFRYIKSFEVITPPKEYKIFIYLFHNLSKVRKVPKSSANFLSKISSRILKFILHTPWNYESIFSANKLKINFKLCSCEKKLFFLKNNEKKETVKKLNCEKIKKRHIFALTCWTVHKVKLFFNLHFNFRYRWLRKLVKRFFAPGTTTNITFLMWLWLENKKECVKLTKKIKV